MKGSQKKARQGVLLSVIDFEVLTSFNRFAVWVLGAGYFWTVTIDILGITRRTGTGWRHAMGVSILIRMLPIINQIVFVNEHASVLLKNVDYLLIAKPVLLGEDVNEEELGEFLGSDGVVTWDENTLLRGAVDDHQDRGESVRRRKVLDEVGGNGVPRTFRPDAR